MIIIHSLIRAPSFSFSPLSSLVLSFSRSLYVVYTHCTTTTGLWLLFHTLLANSGKSEARRTLSAIHDFVQLFFGCKDCARHFEEMWRTGGAQLAQASRGGGSGGAQAAIDTSVWLWKAHNHVRARISRTDDSTPLKSQWPSIDECPVRSNVCVPAAACCCLVVLPTTHFVC
jgi:hypothetical protein